MNPRALRQQLAQQGLTAPRLTLPVLVYFGVAKDVAIEGPPDRRVLRWTENDETTPWPERTSLDCLYRFAALADSRDEEDFVQFATRWGVLELCRHDAPYSHNHEPPAWDFCTDLRQQAAQATQALWNPQREDLLASRALAQLAQLPPDPGARRTLTGTFDPPDSAPIISAWCEPTGSESLDAWRSWARRAQAMLRITAHLNRQRERHPDNRRAAPVEQWRHLYFPAAVQEAAEHAAGADWFSAERLKLALVLQQWTLLGRVTPTFIDSPTGEVQAGLSAEGVFGALAAQLAAVISTGEGVYACSRCGAAWPSDRHPRSDREFYCDTCRPEMELKWKREDAARRRAGRPTKRQLRNRTNQEDSANGEE
jgi:hypothetical protein